MASTGKKVKEVDKDIDKAKEASKKLYDKLIRKHGVEAMFDEDGNTYYKIGDEEYRDSNADLIKEVLDDLDISDVELSVQPDGDVRHMKLASVSRSGRSFSGVYVDMGSDEIESYAKKIKEDADAALKADPSSAPVVVPSAEKGAAIYYDPDRTDGRPFYVKISDTQRQYYSLGALTHYYPWFETNPPVVKRETGDYYMLTLNKEPEDGLPASYEYVKVDSDEIKQSFDVDIAPSAVPSVPSAIDETKLSVNVNDRGELRYKYGRITRNMTAGDLEGPSFRFGTQQLDSLVISKIDPTGEDKTIHYYLWNGKEYAKADAETSRLITSARFLPPLGEIPSQPVHVKLNKKNGNPTFVDSNGKTIKDVAACFASGKVPEPVVTRNINGVDYYFVLGGLSYRPATASECDIIKISHIAAAAATTAAATPKATATARSRASKTSKIEEVVSSSAGAVEFKSLFKSKDKTGAEALYEQTNQIIQDDKHSGLDVLLKVNGAEKSPCIICVEQAGKHYAFIHNDMLDDKFKAKAISGPAASTDYSLYEIETIDIVDSSAKAGNERGFQIKLAGSDITIRSNARAIEISSSTDKLTATPADADKGTFGYDFSKKLIGDCFDASSKYASLQVAARTRGKLDIKPVSQVTDMSPEFLLALAYASDPASTSASATASSSLSTTKYGDIELLHIPKVTGTSLKDKSAEVENSPVLVRMKQSAGDFKYYFLHKGKFQECKPAIAGAPLVSYSRDESSNKFYVHFNQAGTSVTMPIDLTIENPKDPNPKIKNDESYQALTAIDQFMRGKDIAPPTNDADLEAGTKTEPGRIGSDIKFFALSDEARESMVSDRLRRDYYDLDAGIAATAAPIVGAAPIAAAPTAGTTAATAGATAPTAGTTPASAPTTGAAASTPSAAPSGATPSGAGAPPISASAAGAPPAAPAAPGSTTTFTPADKSAPPVVASSSSSTSSLRPIVKTLGQLGIIASLFVFAAAILFPAVTAVLVPAALGCLAAGAGLYFGSNFIGDTMNAGAVFDNAISQQKSRKRHREKVAERFIKRENTIKRLRDRSSDPSLDAKKKIKLLERADKLENTNYEILASSNFKLIEKIEEKKAEIAVQQKQLAEPDKEFTEDEIDAIKQEASDNFYTEYACPIAQSVMKRRGEKSARRFLAKRTKEQRIYIVDGANEVHEAIQTKDYSNHRVMGKGFPAWTRKPDLAQSAYPDYEDLSNNSEASANWIEEFSDEYGALEDAYAAAKAAGDDPAELKRLAKRERELEIEAARASRISARTISDKISAERDAHKFKKAAAAGAAAPTAPTPTAPTPATPTTPTPATPTPAAPTTPTPTAPTTPTPATPTTPTPAAPTTPTPTTPTTPTPKGKSSSHSSSGPIVTR